MGLGPADSAENVTAFLARNPGLSVVAEEAGRLVGTALCGQDGRRGFIYHLALAKEFRGAGTGRALVNWCLEGLRRQGLTRCHIIVYAHNEEGRRFWAHLGFCERTELLLCAHDLKPSERPAT
jgi:ribosomal protein S18 acetylase RimI-like enzyme